MDLLLVGIYLCLSSTSTTTVYNNSCSEYVLLVHSAVTRIAKLYTPMTPELNKNTAALRVSEMSYMLGLSNLIFKWMISR